MSLFDFFFPEQAQAAHLRSIASRQRLAARRSSRTNRSQAQLEARIDALEGDLGYVTLLLGSLLGQLDEKGVLTREELKTTIAALDELDGVADGRLDVNVLRGLGSV